MTRQFSAPIEPDMVTIADACEARGNTFAIFRIEEDEG